MASRLAEPMVPRRCCGAGVPKPLSEQSMKSRIPVWIFRVFVRQGLLSARAAPMRPDENARPLGRGLQAKR